VAITTDNVVTFGAAITVRMKREDGVLEVALHTRGGPLEFNGYVHEALVTRSAISATIGITTSRS